MNWTASIPRCATERSGAIAAISIGGVFGAIARYAVGLWATAWWGTAFPWGTLLVNVAGSFVLGFYLMRASERSDRRPVSRLFIATGFLGSFTTFSAFSYEVVRLFLDGAALSALTYVVASLLLGLAAALAGVVLAHAL